MIKYVKGWINTFSENNMGLIIVIIILMFAFFPTLTWWLIGIAVALFSLYGILYVVITVVKEIAEAIGPWLWVDRSVWVRRGLLAALAVVTVMLFVRFTEDREVPAEEVVEFTVTPAHTNPAEESGLLPPKEAARRMREAEEKYQEAIAAGDGQNWLYEVIGEPEPSPDLQESQQERTVKPTDTQAEVDRVNAFIKQSFEAQEARQRAAEARQIAAEPLPEPYTYEEPTNAHTDALVRKQITPKMRVSDVVRFKKSAPPVWEH